MKQAVSKCSYPKHLLTFTSVEGDITEKIELFINTVVRT
jgi:hypothetical protein